MHRKIFLLIVTLLILFMMIGCGGSSDDSGGSTETGNPALTGVIQKGPFYRGATIVIKELDHNDLMPTGVEHVIESANDLGEFEFRGSAGMTSSYVEISATGYYFNEVYASQSYLPITLSVFADISVSQTINLNILTTIAVKREKYLITHDAKTYAEAKIQARNDVLNAFKFTEDVLGALQIKKADAFTQMNIGQDGEKNAVLLSLSILLQNFQNEHPLWPVSEVMQSISGDIEKDGVIDDTDSIDILFKDAAEIDLTGIRENLENYYRALVKWFRIPDFESIFENHIIPQTQTPEPIFSLPSATYNRDITVELHCVTTGAAIYYSINGSAPAVYVNPIEIAGNGTVVNLSAWSDIYYMEKSSTVSSYYVIDYDYDDDPANYKTDMTIDEYRTNITGTWIGHIERPLQWLSPDNVKITFSETRQYSAERISFFIESDNPVTDINQTTSYAQRGSDFCYGADTDSEIKTIDIKELTANGKAVADLISLGSEGEVNIAGKLENIAMSDDFNHLHYDFWCDELHGESITFHLTRLME